MKQDCRTTEKNLTNEREENLDLGYMQSLLFPLVIMVSNLYLGLGHCWSFSI